MRLNRTDKFTAIISAILLLLGFFYFVNSLTPARSKSQKVYDDFVHQLAGFAAESAKTSSPVYRDKEETITPGAEIKFLAKFTDSGQNLQFKLDWQDKSRSRKALRILELLSMANIFSASQDSSTANRLEITVISSSGYKFHSQIRADKLQEIPSLQLALVLMRELTS